MKTILVPLDGSPFAEHALPVATGLAEASGARLLLATVHATPVSGIGEMVLDSHFQLALADVERIYLEEAVRRVKEVAGIAVEHSILSGATTQALCDFAAESTADLVVMSTHGRGGFRRTWLGSVADSLVRHLTSAPVLLVRPRRSEDRPADLRPTRIRRALVALDGSAASEAVIPMVREICALHGADCVLISVVVPPLPIMVPSVPDTSYYPQALIETGRGKAMHYLEAIAVELPAVVRTEVVTGHEPAHAILSLADEVGADLIAVGTRGAGSAARALMGSVADKVVRGASVPVLVRHTEAQAPTR